MSKNNVFSPNAKGPVRFEKLRPGSFFTIVAEPSRNISRSTDKRVYQKDLNGFFSEEFETGNGCVLHPQDLVMPMRRGARPAAPKAV